MAILCHSSIAARWLSARPDPTSLLLGQPPVEARSSGEGRGLGLFTTRAIPAYTEILREAPTILLEPTDDLPQLYEQFLSLREPGSDALQQIYLSLSHHEIPERDTRLRSKLRERGFDEASIEEMVKVASIMQTNAFNVDLATGKGRNHRALFAQIARINHSCAPNAHVCFYTPTNEKRGRMVIHALKDLQPGEEVLIAYFSIVLSPSERQTKAQKWGFTCACSACSSHPNNDEHEQLRSSIVDFTTKQAHLLQNKYNNKPTLQQPQITSLISTGISIISNLTTSNNSAGGGLRPTIPDLYENLAMLRAKLILLQRKDSTTQREGVVEFLKLATIWEAKLTGMGSPATRKRLQKVEEFASVKKGSARVVEVGGGEYVVDLV